MSAGLRVVLCPWEALVSLGGGIRWSGGRRSSHERRKIYAGTRETLVYLWSSRERSSCLFNLQAQQAFRKGIYTLHVILPSFKRWKRTEQSLTKYCMRRTCSAPSQRIAYKPVTKDSIYRRSRPTVELVPSCRMRTFARLQYQPARTKPLFKND